MLAIWFGSAPFTLTTVLNRLISLFTLVTPYAIEQEEEEEDGYGHHALFPTRDREHEPQGHYADADANDLSQQITQLVAHHQRR